ncbi:MULTISPECIES: hypothetical protein [unclassified Pseudoalteromonas]|uniref:hypothetical protein n=1 Tax=unclassified Pseudoalteromonas TaxID=194690 RepID=UPI00110A860B|nr:MULTISPECIES: hypothetical protein [unclassified Pseudoalteromonas]TMP41387.1 hypothetical protein CWB80_21015 [Pseudoalteromonas sp. S1650]TMP64449.1 hypothetical protein CWB79_20735 [Pseudoalteromonas sp. S1649]
MFDFKKEINVEKNTFKLSKKVQFAGFTFSIVCFSFSFYLQLNSEEINYLIKPLKYIISRYPTLKEVIDFILVDIFSVVSIVFASCLMPLILRMAFNSRYKNLEYKVTGKNLQTINIFTGVMITIPFSTIDKIDFKKNGVHINFIDSKHEIQKHHIPISYLIDGDRFSQQLATNFNKFKNNDLNSDEKYTITYHSCDYDKTALPKLSKILKTDLTNISKQLYDSGIEIKRSISSSNAKKLISALRKINIPVKITKNKKSHFIDDKKTSEINSFFIPTFTAIVIIELLPGGMILLLLIINKICENARIKIKAGAGSMMLASLFELIASSAFNVENPISFIIFSVISPIILSAIIAFNLKNQLEHTYKGFCNRFLTAIFGVYYLTFKINRLVTNSHKEI